MKQNLKECETFYEMYMSNSPCNTCHGARLKKEILSDKVGEKILMN